MPAQTAGGRNGGGRGKYKQANKQLVETLREACPPHKLDDLEALVRDLKGDEGKIREKISEWWEEPDQHQAEGEWEDVNKKGTVGKKKDFKQQSRGGRGDGRGRGRGNREGRGRGHSERSDGVPRNDQKSKDQKGTIKSDSQNGRSHGLPPVESVRVPQGAWSKRTDSAGPPVEVIVTGEPFETGTEIDRAAVAVAPASIPHPPKSVQGNVWATKGSAHIIRAEKPVPPPPAVAPAPRQTNSATIPRATTKDPSPALATIQRNTPQSPTPEHLPSPPSSSIADAEQIVSHPTPPSDPQPILETGLSQNVWSSGTASEASTKLVDSPSSPILSKAIGSGPISLPSTAVASSLVVSSVADVSQQVPSAPLPKPPEPKLVAPTSFINMGHWETDDTDDTNLDFGFGTFDAASAANDAISSASDVANSPPTSGIDPSHSTSQPSAANASPARPPPGLTIGGGGMPPMPPNAVLVHELENKLEQVSIDANSKQANGATDKPISSMQQHQPSQSVHDIPSVHMPNIHSQNPYGTSSQYATAMGMGYAYGGGHTGTAVNAFVGMHGPGAPVLGTPPQPPPPKPPQPAGGPLQGASGGLYGSHTVQSAGSVPGSAVGGNTTDSVSTSNAGIPPGMPNPGMPYGNAPVYYGQQPPFHMGHSQGGIGYNYYGAQFGSVQGFGYPQGMGQSGAYGHGPYHDDPGVAGTHSHQQQASSGGYQAPKNNSGGYRAGRNHHNNANQYQQSHQYTPQQHHQGGYVGQPYSMGYHNDHFGQRGAYGGMQDPYGMQPQQAQGAGGYGVGFQTDDQYKGKNKGNRSGSLQHFQQQGPPQPLSTQQGFGLQGQVASDSNQQGGSGGWSNQHSSGWSGGTSGWQQK